MKLRYICMAAIFPLIFLTSCSKDDEPASIDEPISEEEISDADFLGYWKNDECVYVIDTTDLTFYELNEENPAYYDYCEIASWTYKKSTNKFIIFTEDENMSWEVSRITQSRITFIDDDGCSLNLYRTDESAVPTKCASDGFIDGDDDSEDESDKVNDDDNSTNSGPVATAYASGDGSAESPYIINTAAQLRKLAADSHNGYSFTGKYFKLGGDVRLNSVVIDSDYNLITPASQLEQISIENFDGTFDGNGYTISGLYSDEAGVFTNAKENAIFKNIVIKDSYISDYFIHNVKNHPINSIENIINYGYIKDGIVKEAKNVYNCGNYGKCFFVPIAYMVYENIVNCYNYGSVGGVSTGAIGIVYYCSGNVFNCVNFGSLSSDEYATTGIAGYVYSTDGTYTAELNNCVNIGTLSTNSSSSTYKCGIVYCGYRYSAFKNSICKNAYYLQTSASRAVGTGFKTKSDVLSLAAEEMQSDEFLAKLNANAAQIPGACNWKHDSSGYPTLEIVKQ